MIKENGHYGVDSNDFIALELVVETVSDEMDFSVEDD
jgi:hypothetical protein